MALIATCGGSHPRIRADVDPPAGELCGKARVLALLADRQAELSFGYDHVGDLVLLVDADIQHFRRRKSLGHVLRWILVPQHDVHLLAVELGHDRLDPRSKLTHGRSLGVAALLAALPRDPRPAAGLPGDAADHGCAVVDLGDLHLHQAAQKAAMRPAGDDHRSARGAADLENVRLEVLADAVVLPRQLLADGENRLDALTHVQDHGRLGRAVHDAGHDLPLPTGVLLEDHVALRLAKPLAIDLASGLRRGA